MPKVSEGKLKRIRLDEIDEPSGVVRLEIDPDEVADLGANIKEVGLLQPILVRPVGDRFEIVAGHRRYLAVRGLGWKEIRCIIRRIDDIQCALARASENLRRVDLSPIEEAAIYSDLLDNHKLTYDQIGKRMGKTAGVVKRRLDLLRMPPQLQKAIHKKQISYGVAEELWSLQDIGAIDYYLGFAIDHGVTVAVARDWVKDWKAAKRREASDVEGGGEPQSPAEVRPTYLPCDICHGPEDVMKMSTVHCCEVCGKKLKAAFSDESE